jgi:ferritin-like protein
MLEVQCMEKAEIDKNNRDILIRDFRKSDLDDLFNLLCVVLPTKTDKNPNINQQCVEREWTAVPLEIHDSERFIEISSNADYCAVKKLQGVVKLKLRTAHKLYTLKIEPLKAEEIIKKLQCEIREI